jgi:protein TonB
MIDRTLISSFTASSFLHVILVSVAVFTPPNRDQSSKAQLVAIRLVDLSSFDETSPPTAVVPKAKPQTIIPPKLLSRPDPVETLPRSPTPKEKEEKKPEKSQEEPAPLFSLPSEADPEGASRSASSGPATGEGGLSAETNLSGTGEVTLETKDDVNRGSGKGAAVRGASRDSGFGAGGLGSSLARPLGGYQVKPRYPDSARRSGAQGTTLLKLRILESGKVESVLIAQSAGHPDLDKAAAEAVKKWLFEPARNGHEPVAVWVLLPVKFELQ